jgi:hypothetical protein
MHAKHPPRPSPHFALALAAFAGIAAAQNAPPPIPAALRARFGFTGPLVAKIGDGIGNLQVADLDGDGRVEAIVADARRARLAAIRIAGEGTEVQAIPTDGQIAGYGAADVHGDGKPDLLLVDNRGRLHVRHPGGGRSDQPIDLGLGGRGIGILSGDLDGDGKADVVAFTHGKLRWLTKLGGTPVASPIEPIEENAHSFELFDVDGDKALDLMFVAPGPSMNLRLRLGRGDGTFGPWHLGQIDNLNHLFATRLPGGAPAVATIEGPNRRVALHRFADHGAQAALEWWALGENQATKVLPFATGDFDQDGDEDLVLAQPERAQLLFFEWRQGTFTMRTLPSLAGVASLAAGDVDRDGKLDLVLASPEEDALAWKSGALPIDAFPVQIGCVDKPVAAAVDPDGGVLVLARTEKRDAHLDRAMPGAEPVRLLDVGRLPADPMRLLVADVGHADGREVAFVVPGEGLRVLSQTAAAAKGDKDDKKAKTGDAAGFTKKMDDGSLTLTEHDGKPALLAVRERFLRRFRTDARGQVQVLAQDNGPEGMAELSLAAPLGGGVRIYLDKKNNKLVRARAGETSTSIDVPAFEFTHLVPHGEAVLLLGARGVLRVPFGSGPSLQSIAVHEPPIVRTNYWHGQSGDFDHDGCADLAVIDGHLPGVQILAGGDGLQRALAIPVFETPPRDEPGNEPRDLATGDLDGDGRTDLVVLVHDRVLIYLQEK